MKKQLNKLHIIWLCLGPCFASAQAIWPDIQFDYHEPKSGMPSGLVTSFTQDSLGRLWIGSYDGLICYDGFEQIGFQHNPSDSTSIPSNRINHVASVSSHEILISHVSGFSIFHTQTFRTQNLLSLADQERFGQIYYGLPMNDTCWWLGAEKGLIQYNPISKDLNLILPTGKTETIWDANMNQVKRIHVDPFNPQKLWLLTLPGLTHFDMINQTFVEYERNPGYRPNSYQKLGEHYFEHMDFDIDSAGVVWIATWGDGLNRVDPITHTWDSFLAFEEDYPNILVSLQIDIHQNIWVGSRVSSLGQFDTQNHSYTWLSELEGRNDVVKESTIPAIYFDHEERIWVGMGKGFSVHDPYKFVLHSKLNASVHKLFKVFISQTNNKVYLSDFNGLQILGSQGEVEFSSDEVLVDGQMQKIGRIMDIFEGPNQQIYIAASNEFQEGANGLFEFDPINRTIHQKQIKDVSGDILLSNFNSIFVDEENTKWIGGDFSGVLKGSKKSWTYYDDYEKQVKVVSFNQDSLGRMWVCSKIGVYHLVPQGDSLRYHPPSHFEKFINLSTHINASCMDDDGMLWIGTRHNGIIKVDPFAQEPDDHKQYNTTSGLSSNNIIDLSFSDGVLWVASSNGLSALILDDQKIIHFSTEEGLVDNWISCVRTNKNGQLYIGNEENISILNISSILKNMHKQSPKVHFVDFKLDGVSTPIYPPPKLNYPSRNFSVEYRGVNFTYGDQNMYQIKLEGADSEWENVGTQRTVAYRQLQPGSYVLKVKSANKMGVWSEEYAALPIHVIPAYWQTNWFKIVVLLSILAILYGAYRYRMAQVRHESELILSFNRQVANAETQALRAQMNPHFIFNALNSIKLYVLNKNPEKGGVYLDAFARLVRAVLQNSKEELISLEKELEALDLYIGLEKLRFNEAFDHQIILEEGLNADFYEIPPLVLQPFVENAIWHGLMPLETKGNLTIHAFKDGDKLCIDIEDNGIGREASARSTQNKVNYKKSMGMDITRDRLKLQKQLHGIEIDVQIKDAYTKMDKTSLNPTPGTKVELRIQYL